MTERKPNATPGRDGRCLYHAQCKDKDTSYYLPDADVFLCKHHLDLYAIRNTDDGAMYVVYRRELREQVRPGERLKTVRHLKTPVRASKRAVGRKLPPRPGASVLGGRINTTRK